MVDRLVTSEREAARALNRSYWQGASGTYCEKCYWGTDLLGSGGASAWYDHDEEVHPRTALAPEKILKPHTTT